MTRGAGGWLGTNILTRPAKHPLHKKYFNRLTICSRFGKYFNRFGCISFSDFWVAKKDILTQFLMEAVAICVLAGLIGLSISYILSIFLNQIFPSNLDLVLFFDRDLLCASTANL